MARAPVSTPPPLPRELQVEVTGACNLRCRMCLVRYRPPLDRVTASMDLATFERLVDELPELDTVTLQGLGEPLLAPDLFPMIAYAAQRGIRVGFNTNGTVLTRDKGERLVESGLAWLHVSVDGATAGTYEGVRDGSNLQRVARNVKELVATKARLGAARPRLSLVFVAMRRNLHELPAVVALAAEWGVMRLWVQNLSHSFADTGGADEYREISRFTADEALWAGDGGQVDEVFEHARRRADAEGVELRLPKVESPPERRAVGAPGCDWPWRSGYVTHEGRLQPCCMVMGADRAVLGDLRRESFPVAWRGVDYEAFRQALLGDEAPEVCQGCSMYRGVF